MPPRTDVFTNGDPLKPPPLDQIQSWTGSFSGTLVPDPLCTTAPCDANRNLQAVTRMAIYTDQCLNPGWQRCRVGRNGMPNVDMNGNTVTIKVSYFWNQADFPDQPSRVEFYSNFGLDGAATFIDHNKITEYFFQGVNLAGGTYTCADFTKKGLPCTSGFNGSFGLDLTLNEIPGTNPAVCQTGGINCASNPGVANFPPTVTDGRIRVEMWGGSFGPNGQQNGLKPRGVPVSVDADPLTGRASWIMPPYVSAGSGVSAPTRKPMPTATASLAPSATPPTEPTPATRIRTPTRPPSFTRLKSSAASLSRPRLATRRPSPTPTGTPSPSPSATP